jgi:hypothetical protein
MTHDCTPLDDVDDLGCDRCDSTQDLTPDRVHIGIYWLRICHAVGCPVPARARSAGWN